MPGTSEVTYTSLLNPNQTTEDGNEIRSSTNNKFTIVPQTSTKWPQPKNSKIRHEATTRDAAICKVPNLPTTYFPTAT